MTQVMIDLMGYKSGTKIFEELLEAQQIVCEECEKEPLPKLQAAPIRLENNNYTTKNYNRPEEFQCPLEYYYVILDADVEDILQNVSDDLFVKCFSFDKVMVRCLLMELHARTYYHPSEENHPICFDMSVLVTLSYLVNGHLSYVDQLGCLKYYSLPQVKASIARVCQTIVYFLSPVYVRFPCSEDLHDVKYEFFQKFGVPGVVGSLECFYVGISNVHTDNRHMYIGRCCTEPSLAVQVVCDSNFRFLDVNPRFSGNSSNSYVWNRSHIKEIVAHIQNTDANTWLIADRGYPLSPIVINPFRNPLDIQQECVNVALMEIHGVVDKTFALLKGRFRCLNGTIPFSHKHAANIISSCATLHNYLLSKHRSVEDNVYYQPMKVNALGNAKHEDEFSPAGIINRNFLKDFVVQNSVEILCKMRKNSSIKIENNLEGH